MSSRTPEKTPKTGLASRMRAWMSGRRHAFTTAMICDALAIPPGRARERAASTLADFIARAEVIPLGPDRRRRNGVPFYRYNPAWHRAHKGTLNQRIYKAIYVNGTFSAPEIRRLAEAPEASWVVKTIRALAKRRLICKVGRRKCAHGIGAETVWHIPDRDRFKLEVMK
jgi:hypothetical protein